MRQGSRAAIRVTARTSFLLFLVAFTASSFASLLPSPFTRPLRVRLGDIDHITLDVHGTVIERLDLPVDSVDDSSESEDGEDDELAAPLALAIDVDETQVDAPETAAETAVEAPGL